MEMRETVYMFIDGASLQAQIDSTRRIFELSEDKDIEYSELISSANRAFYYDSYPSRKPSQSDEDYDAEFKKSEDLFKKISATTNMHLKTGLSRYDKRKRGREQKAVDIILALDMYRHAIQGSMDSAIILTNDLDFAPVLEALLDTRVQSTLWFNPRKTNNLLRDTADISSPFNELSVMQSMPAAVKKPYWVKLQQITKPAVQLALDRTVSRKCGDDWEFNVYKNKKGDSYYGHFSSVQGWMISSPDFRSVRLEAERSYGIDLTDLKVPKVVNLELASQYR